MFVSIKPIQLVDSSLPRAQTVSFIMSNYSIKIMDLKLYLSDKADIPGNCWKSTTTLFKYCRLRKGSSSSISSNGNEGSWIEW